jgi:hypothetical protein
MLAINQTNERSMPNHWQRLLLNFLKLSKKKLFLPTKNAAREVVHAMLLLSKLKISLLFLVL